MYSGCQNSDSYATGLDIPVVPVDREPHYVCSGCVYTCAPPCPDVVHDSPSAAEQTTKTMLSLSFTPRSPGETCRFARCDAQSEYVYVETTNPANQSQP